MQAHHHKVDAPDDDYDVADDDEDFEAPLILEHIKPQQEETLRDLFSVFDQLGKGYLHPSELRIALRMAGCEVTRDEAHALIATHCRDREEGLTVSEFLNVCDELIGRRPDNFREAMLTSVFSNIDAENHGELDATAIARWARTVNDCEPNALDDFLNKGPSTGHAAPDHLSLPPLERELSTNQGIERFMTQLGLDPSNRISREAFLSLLLSSDTIV